MKKITGILIGTILIVLGIVCILGILEIVSFDFSLDGWWTLFIIIPCISGLFTDRDKTGSIIGLSLGILLLLAARDIVEYSTVWKIIIPLIFVMIGIKIIIKSLNSSSENSHRVGKEVNAVFCEKNANYDGEKISTANVKAIFGGTECNMKNVEFKEGNCINLSCIFGGAEILLPENVRVKNNVFCLFGGISDERVIDDKDGEFITVSINGVCIFGGVDIK